MPDADDGSDDVALLHAWAAGDRDAGNRLFRRFFPAIFRFFSGKAAAAADELTQKTFLGALENAARVDPARGFRGYLFGIARNQLLMHLRDGRRDAARFDPQTWSLIDVGPLAAQAVAYRHEQEIVAAALQRVPLDYQCALEFYYWDGLGVKEIADALEVPEGTVKARLSRGRKLLRAAIEALGTQAPELLQSTVGDLERWLRAHPGAVVRRRHDPDGLA